MATDFGVNVAPGGRDHPISGTGRWRRIVLSGPPLATANALSAYHREGCLNLGVVTKQVAVELDSGDKRKVARIVFAMFGPSLDAVQVWNEPDGSGPTSDQTTKAEYNAWLGAFRDEARRIGWTKPLVAAGLVTGQPSYLGGIDMTGYRLALHPYDQRVIPGDWGHNDLDAYLDAYTPYLPGGTGFWLTECSRTTNDESLQARYAAALVQHVRARRDVAVCLWYCWQDWRLAGNLQPFGLTREDGSHKPALGAWVEAVQMAESSTPVWANDKQRIEEQISLLVENQRRILMGKWDEARMFLDAIDPAHQGQWTNHKFPACEAGCNHSGG